MLNPIEDLIFSEAYSYWKHYEEFVDGALIKPKLEDAFAFGLNSISSFTRDLGGELTSKHYCKERIISELEKRTDYLKHLIKRD